MRSSSHLLQPYNPYVVYVPATKRSHAPLQHLTDHLESIVMLYSWSRRVGEGGHPEREAALPCASPHGRHALPRVHGRKHAARSRSGWAQEQPQHRSLHPPHDCLPRRGHARSVPKRQDGGALIYHLPHGALGWETLPVYRGRPKSNDGTVRLGRKVAPDGLLPETWASYSESHHR